ncbi:hypothetical protein TanjilG_06619 [Lupinus angustifolius]|uniref:Uncharacterized protein n=1 Tax=Lupinus angustifolius TaxID=3871 RepID=A0A394D9N2_LUPAN|nr:hypothetical protein TanjilG_06619 [Lupinus angustifolius]
MRDPPVALLLPAINYDVQPPRTIDDDSTSMDHDQHSSITNVHQDKISSVGLVAHCYKPEGTGNMHQVVRDRMHQVHTGKAHQLVHILGQDYRINWICLGQQ